MEETLFTTVNREYVTRFLGVAALFLGLTGWFLYDGFVGYPAENARVAPILAELAKESLTGADWVNPAKTGTAPLTEAFREHGMEPPAKIADTFNSWVSAGDPRANDPEAARQALGMQPHSPDDIRAQFVSAAVGVCAALLLVALVVWRWQTRLSLDGAALTVRVFGRERVYPLGDLEAVDDAQWEKRGILRARFRSGTVTLDAWHHAGTRPIAERLLARRPQA